MFSTATSGERPQKTLSGEGGSRSSLLLTSRHFRGVVRFGRPYTGPMKLLVTTALLISSVWATAPARSFSVEVTGKGKPMILIPGLASSGKTWDSTVAHYKDKYECHVLTLAGFAGQPPMAWQQDAYLQAVRDDIITYIRDKKLQRPAIVGHSLGGFLALWIGEEAPDLVGRLVIVDSLPFFAGVMDDQATVDSVKPMVEQMRKTMKAQTAEQAAKMSEMQIRMMVTGDADFEMVKGWGRESDRPTVNEAFAELFSNDIRPGLSKIQSPTLVMGTWIGYKDYATREQVDKRFHDQYAALKNAKIVLTDTARHFIMLDDREGFLRDLDAFLKP